VREVSVVQAEQEAKKREDEQGKGRGPSLFSPQDNERDSEAETVVDTGVVGSKAVEVREAQVQGELKVRGSPAGENKSEASSTEDEWEKVSDENETEKDK